MRFYSRFLILALLGLLVLSPVAVNFVAAQGTPAVPGPSSLTDDDIPVGRDLTPEQLLRYRPNELGVIPIIMYHNIMEDPESGVPEDSDHLYRRADELYADLKWLYDRDFYLIGMLPLIEGRIDVPPGKHPVVLTFDDSSSMHLSFQVDADGNPIQDANGEYLPTPDCAVGVIEQFARDYPDFGKTAHFAVISPFKFSWPQYEQDDLFQAKLQWLLDHGYEIGNHTSDHEDLAAASLDDFARMIAEPNIVVSGLVDPNSPGYAMNVLTLPFGSFPSDGWTGDKGTYIRGSFVWDGQTIHVDAILLVCCEPTQSRFNVNYEPLWINRIRGDETGYADLETGMNEGTYLLYTSDGDPDTVMVPWPLPNSQVGEVNFEAIKAYGRDFVKYDPDTGQIYKPRSKPGH